MSNEQSELEREAERQCRIDSLLQGIEGIDHKFEQDGEEEILKVMQSRETPVQRAAEKLLEAGWKKINAGFDDPYNRYDWFTFRIPDELK